MANKRLRYIRGKFNTELEEGDYFKFDSMEWRIYKIMDEFTFTAWEDSGEVDSLKTFSINETNFEIIQVG